MRSETAGVRRLVMLLAVSVLTGCGSGDTGRSPVHPVKGTVTYEGAPVADALVTFHGGARLAVGRTNEAGKFTLTTYEDGDGATEGEHVVTVTKFEGSAAPAATDESVSMEAAMKQPTRQAKPKNLLPVKYADAAKKAYTVEVSADGENDLAIELTD